MQENEQRVELSLYKLQNQTHTSWQRRRGSGSTWQVILKRLLWNILKKPIITLSCVIVTKDYQMSAKLLKIYYYQGNQTIRVSVYAQKPKILQTAHSRYFQV